MKRRHIHALLVVFLLLGFGCSDTALQDTRSSRIVPGDQVQILVPAHDKSAEADTCVDFTLLVHPNANCDHSQDNFKLKARRGSVTQDVLVTAHWLGNEAVDPALGFQFGPEGQAFLLPLEMKFKLRLADFPGVNPALLTVVLDREDGSYELIPTDQIPEPGGTITLRADVDHFSRYLVAVGPPPNR